VGRRRFVTSAEAIQFLTQHQPLPPDRELSEELISKFDEARLALQADPDPRGLRLLLGALGEGSGFGVYQLIPDTLHAYPRSDVVAAIEQALRSPLPSVRSWAMEFALDYADLKLVPGALKLLESDDRDARFFAASFLVDVGPAPETRAALEAAARRETDLEIREILHEGLAALRD
jgi:hypothetical protein